jgi:hypothetical protein
MGQFKPMVKMMTDEPSVILKLKKGGKVAKMAMGGNDFVPMQSTMPAQMPAAAGAPMGMAPKRPSMMARRKAMNPNMMMKKGGNVEKELHKMEKELKHHENMKASKAHHGLKHGGKVHHVSGHPEDSHEHHKHMAKHHAKMHKEGGSAHHKKMAEHHKAMCKGGSYASGGAIDKDETHTTIEGNAKKFEKTKMVDGQHHDKASGTKGIKDGKPAGYKTGGAIPSDTHEKKNVGKSKMHGTIEGNEHDYLNTEMHEAKRDKASGTKGIKETNAGGFKKGGMVPGIGRAIEGGNWENRPADTAHGGKQNGTTSGVRESNAGGYKHGGHAAKKHYATGGNVVDDGKAVKMPKHFVSRPVANSMQSGTFKKGGNVKKFDDGGSSYDDKYTVKDPKAVSDKASRELEDAMNPLSMAKELYGKAKGYFTPPAGSVTKTEKSVTVAPGKKRGGSAMC